MIEERKGQWVKLMTQRSWQRLLLQTVKPRTSITLSLLRCRLDPGDHFATCVAGETRGQRDETATHQLDYTRTSVVVTDVVPGGALMQEFWATWRNEERMFWRRREECRGGRRIDVSMATAAEGNRSQSERGESLPHKDSLALNTCGGGPLPSKRISTLFFIQILRIRGSNLPIPRQWTYQV